jgi:hypothetical protein
MSRFIKKKKSDLVNLENVIGVLLAILIVFDLSLEVPLANALNTTLGMVSSFIIVIILFSTLNPIIGILFIIYLYQNYKSPSQYHTQQKKDDLLQQLNPPLELQVEEEIILEKAPIVNQGFVFL